MDSLTILLSSDVTTKIVHSEKKVLSNDFVKLSTILQVSSIVILLKTKLDETANSQQEYENFVAIDYLREQLKLPGR